MSLFFKLHVIPPPFTLDWSTPRALLIRTLAYHLMGDQAPIGHFFIEFETQKPNAFGVKHVLTGMSRLNKNQSTLAVIKEQVGLGTFFYDFEGKLDDARDAKKELAWAKKKNRLKTITVPITTETADLLMSELDAWIKNGSFKHYGGGHRVISGEGAGCAEFGAHFFNLATGKLATHPSWYRSVYAKNNLVGGHKTGKKVPLSKIFLEGSDWAKSEAEGILYSTPDMELTSHWLEKNYPAQNEIQIEPREVRWAETSAQKISFQAGYPVLTMTEAAEQFKRVGLS